jgi:hypothetical protein
VWTSTTKRKIIYNKAARRRQLNLKSYWTIQCNRMLKYNINSFPSLIEYMVEYHIMQCKVKRQSKAIPVTDRGGLQSCETDDSPPLVPKYFVWIQSSRASLTHVLILSCHLRRSIPCGLFPPAFPNNTLYEFFFLLFSIHATCSANTVFLIIIPVMFEKSRSYEAPHHVIFSSVLCSNKKYWIGISLCI